ncbi:MAG TPA: M23 family metallopeptidase [Trueperaceae bacterium]|nr:M23 family metallopeptidase [Trueperaceae bacterium]
MRKTRVAACLTLVAFTLPSLALADAYALKTVRPGDSVSLIAERYGVSVDALLGANDLTSTVIRPGDVLRVPYVAAVGGPASDNLLTPPGFTWYSLSMGETLSSVASRFGLPLKAIVGANPDISSLDRLPSGFELLIPPSPGLVVRLGEGENVLDLVAQYDLDPAAFSRANGLRSPFDVTPGMLVFLPGVEPTEALARLQKVREAENRYVWPLHGRLTSYFGPRNLGMGTSSFHRGVDIAAPSGTPVGAARAGTVTYAGWSSQGYGNLVRIRHADGSEAWYGHFSSISVGVGQYVNQSQTIGRVGSTGLSTGPHLHFELHIGSVAKDPLGLLP